MYLINIKYNHMKRLFQFLIFYLVFLGFNVQILRAYTETTSSCTSIIGNYLAYRLYWVIPCLDAIDETYPLDKLSIKLQPFFVSDSVKLDIYIPTETLSGSDICRESSTLIIETKTEAPNVRDWSLVVAATVSYGKKDILRDTVVIALSPDVGDPFQFLDTTVIDFPIWRYMPDELCDKVRETSLRNRVVIDLCNRQRDSVLLAGLKQLPSDEALTYYLKALRIAYRMPYYEEFNRQDDPGLILPRDRVFLPDSVTIYNLRSQIDTLKYDMEMFQSLGLYDVGLDVEKKLKSKLSILEQLELGRDTVVHYASYGACEVMGEYLRRCFQKDSSFVKIALRDGDIPRDLLKEILGEKYIDVYHPYGIYVCPKVQRRVYKLREDAYVKHIRQDIHTFTSMVEEKCLEANQKHEYIIDEIEWFYPQMSQSLEYFGERNQISASKLKILRRELRKKMKYLSKL